MRGLAGGHSCHFQVQLTTIKSSFLNQDLPWWRINNPRPIWGDTRWREKYGTLHFGEAKREEAVETQKTDAPGRCQFSRTFGKQCIRKHSWNAYIINSNSRQGLIGSHPHQGCHSPFSLPTNLLNRLFYVPKLCFNCFWKNFKFQGKCQSCIKSPMYFSPQLCRC